MVVSSAGVLSSPTVAVSSALQPLKALSPIFFTEAGITIDLSEVQLKKQLEPSSTVEPRSTVVSALHLLNAEEPKTGLPSTLRLTSPVQFSKALYFTVVTDAGRTSAVSFAS